MSTQKHRWTRFREWLGARASPPRPTSPSPALPQSDVRAKGPDREPAVAGTSQVTKSDFQVTAQLLTPYALYDPDEFMRAVRLYCALMSDVLPQKCGWSEPLRQPFDVAALDALMHSWGVCETMFWKRTKHPKATGRFGVRWRSASEALMDIHGDIQVEARLGDVDVGSLTTFIKAASVDLAADFAFVESINDAYKGFARISRFAEYGCVGLTTHVLRHWLPDVYWATVFGPAYVELFGLASLLRSPAFSVEQIAEEAVFVQLTPSLYDVHADFARVQGARAAVKAHLGVDAFFDPARAYDTRQHGPVGTTFTTPRFQLKPSRVEPLYAVWHD